MFGFGTCGKHKESSFGGDSNCNSKAAILKELKLSDEQLERFAELKLEGLTHCSQIKATMGKQIQSLVHELTQESINKNKIGEITQHIKSEKEKIADSMVNRVISFAELLTPEQRKKLRMLAIKKFLGLYTTECEE